MITAEEFLIDWGEIDDSTHPNIDIRNKWIEKKNQLIQFAKLHVKASLEAASEQAVAKENPADYGTGEIWVDEKSILNAYPLNNIK